MNIAYEYSLKRRHEFNNIKSGIVTYGDTEVIHFQNMKNRHGSLGMEGVNELYEYKNFNYKQSQCFK